jgi:hypothetical protein
MFSAEHIKAGDLVKIEQGTDGVARVRLANGGGPASFVQSAEDLDPGDPVEMVCDPWPRIRRSRAR